MSHIEHVTPIYRTSPRRAAKMMAIMLGICIVGGIIFFGMWDYWISGTSPAAGGVKAEVAAPVVATGKEIPVSLKFIESSDFRTMAFNALPGEPDNNPTITAEVGDKIIFNVENVGKSFHAFGVVTIPEEDKGSPFEHGPYQSVPGSEIGSTGKPLKPGEGGQSEFVPGKEGPEQTMEPEAMVPFTGTISVPSGSSTPGCEEVNECYIPAEVTVNVGDTVTWSNDDSAAHTVTSGTPTGGPDGTFDSSLFMADATFSHTFDNAGEYNYFCMVHPWMTGKIQVN